jgi:hypothetical protein
MLSLDSSINPAPSLGACARRLRVPVAIQQPIFRAVQEYRVSQVWISSGNPVSGP